MAGWHVDQGPPGDPKGRRVVADQTFQAGDVVLREHAYAYVLYDDQLTRRCDCCLELADNLLRCSGCKLAHYKNREHQLKAWKRGHKEECSALKQLAPRVPPPTVRLAARAVLDHRRATQGAGSSSAAPTSTLASSRGGGESLCGDRYGEVLSLQHHWESTPDRLKVQYAQMGALAWQLVRLANPAAAEEVTPRELALLIARFACNNHTICDDELRPVGVGVFPLMSMVNHSCNPNCMQSFQGSTLVLRAIRPIAPGEEVSITYVELGATRWERRASLLSQYYFDIDLPSTLEHSTHSMHSTQPATALAAAAEAGAESGAGSGAVEPVQCTAGCGTQGQRRLAVKLARVVQLSEGVQLRVYRGAVPPWPHDKRDVDLTAMCWADAAKDQPAAGGMWVEYEDPTPDPSASTLLPGTAGAPSAADWGEAAESFPMDREELGGGAGQALHGGAGEWAAALGGRALTAAAAGGGGASASAARQIVVHFWLQGGAGAAPAGYPRQHRIQQPQRQPQQEQQEVGEQVGIGGGEGEVEQAAVAVMAGTYAQALGQLEAAEQLLGAGGAASAVASAAPDAAGAMSAGNAAAAAQLAQQALEALGCSSSSSSGGGGGGSACGLRRKPPLAGTSPEGQPGLTLGPRHVLRMRLLAVAVRAGVAAGDRWQQALEWMHQLLPLYQFAYPEVWPNLGLHLAGIAKLEHFMGSRPQQAQRAAQHALSVLARTHGGAGGREGVVEATRQVLFEASQELMMQERLGAGQ